jgi:hypothetical protein
MAHISGIVLLLISCLVSVFADNAPIITKRAETSPSNWRGYMGVGVGDETSTNFCK